MIRPVIIMEEYVPPKKRRRITLLMSELYKEADVRSEKFVEAGTIESAAVRDAMASDSADRHDGHILARNIEFRDAELRNIMQSVLAPEIEESGTDDVMEPEDKLIYDLDLPAEFNDGLLKSLKTYMHRFIAWGALYDWYLGNGDPQANVYASQLTDIESAIDGMVRGSSIQKRPMQPFGPAGKMI